MAVTPAVLQVDIIGNSAGLTTSLATASAETEAFAAKVNGASAGAAGSFNAIGTSANRFMGTLVPIAAGGAAIAVAMFAKRSVDAAMEYNRALTQIAAVTNATTDQVAAMQDQIMVLSHQTAQAPVDLAHAMYFLASAGLTTSQAMESLDAVAKGAAVGLGTAGDLAKIEAQALNVFGKSGLTAVGAMDALTAAIREGTAEPDEFANALGRVLPIASKAGISFQQVTASLATMSNAGLQVNIGVTALRGLLQALVAPTKQSRDALSTMGLSVDDVVKSMQQNGLIDTLRLLDQRAKAVTTSTGQYNILLRNLVPNIRSLTALFNLTEQQAAKVDQIFRDVVNSGGDLNKAFEITAESPAFKVKQALNDISVAGMTLASEVLPVLAQVLGFAAEHAQALFTALVAYGALKFVAPLLRDTAAATTELAAAETLATTGARGGGGFAIDAAAIARASAQQAEAAKAAQAAGRDMQYVAGATKDVEAAAGGAASAVTGLASAAGGLMGKVAGLGNALGESLLPQLFGLATAAQRAATGVMALVHGFQGGGGLSGAVSELPAYFNQVKAEMQDLVPLFGGLHLPDFVTPEDTAKATTAFTTIQAGFINAGLTAKQQADIWQKASDQMGNADLSQGDNAQKLVGIIQGLISDQQAANAAQMQSDRIMRESSTHWQVFKNAMSDAAAKLQGFGAIGVDANRYLQDLFQTLDKSDKPTEDFAKAVDDLTQKWQDFHDQAAQSLNFAPGALSDLSSAAQSAADQLANMAPPDKSLKGQALRDYNQQVADLGATANLTGQEIVTSFQDAYNQTKKFTHDLMDIAKFGPGGKALAAQLLQSGDVFAAHVIATAPQEKQITGLYQKTTHLADQAATKLTNTIVGPLNTMVDILTKLAENVWKIDVNGDGVIGVHDKVGKTQKAVDHLTKPKHRLNLFLKDEASGKLNTVQSDVDHLTGQAHKVTIDANTTPAEKALHTFDNNVDKLTSKKRVINIIAHIHPGSPWPDEAMKTHFSDPLKRMGFTQHGDSWSVPLHVTPHTNDPTGGGGRHGGGVNLGPLIRVESHQLQVLLDIRQALRQDMKKGGGDGGSKGSGTGGGTGTGGTTGGTGGGSTSVDTGSGTLDRYVRHLEKFVADAQNKKHAQKWAEVMAAELAKPGRSAAEAKAIKQVYRDIKLVATQKEATDAIRKLKDAIDKNDQRIRQEQRQQQMADLVAQSLKHVPGMPRGRTHIDPIEHHHHGGTGQIVKLDRKHFDQQLAYNDTYRGY